MKKEIEALVHYQIFGSSYSYAGSVSGNNVTELKRQAKNLVRQSGACGYSGFKGITISLELVDSGENIVFNPRN